LFKLFVFVIWGIPSHYNNYPPIQTCVVAPEGERQVTVSTYCGHRCTRTSPFRVSGLAVQLPVDSKMYLSPLDRGHTFKNVFIYTRMDECKWATSFVYRRVANDFFVAFIQVYLAGTVSRSSFTVTKKADKNCERRSYKGKYPRPSLIVLTGNNKFLYSQKGNSPRIH
jgi:hypothetical protein